MTEAHVCEQLAQGCYQKVEQPGVEPETFCVVSQHLNHYTIRPAFAVPDNNAEGCEVQCVLAESCWLYVTDIMMRVTCLASLRRHSLPISDREF